jgi:DeoR family transcriptional regulator of aga operon
MLDTRGTYESNVLEGNIKVKMFENSRLHYLLVDSSKFDKASIFRTTGIENVDAIITDKSLSKEYLDKLKNRNTEVITPKNIEESYQI